MRNRIYRLQYKYGRYAVNDLMKIIAIGQLAVYMIEFMFPVFRITEMLQLTRAGLLHGQLWRLITFLFIPPNTSLLFVFFSLYFYYILGTALERTWGAFVFNVYYILGWLGAVVATLISGVGSNYYLNMSLFFAFAILYPDFEVSLFFVIPLKVKWLAIADGVLFLLSFVSGSWSTRAAIIASLINLFIFFGGDLINRIKKEMGYAKTRQNFRQQSARWNDWNNNNRY